MFGPIEGHQDADQAVVGQSTHRFGNLARYLGDERRHQVEWQRADDVVEVLAVHAPALALAHDLFDARRQANARAQRRGHAVRDRLETVLLGVPEDGLVPVALGLDADRGA